MALLLPHSGKSGNGTVYFIESASRKPVCSYTGMTGIYQKTI
ncbi:hypothetical protein EZS27_007445 [termite gut metagenome]|uniref:Uncharacterized protein n=1 Tax=termite gut metagenome TaxID=433724 RepID=A0A5J4SFS7_9ZZZZ